jgi:hypothetical protein
MITGFGSICWASNWTHLYNNRLWYGPNNGVSGWLLAAGIWFTGYIPPVFVHPAGDGLKAYTNLTGKYISEYRTSDGQDAPVVQLETDGLWEAAAPLTDQRWNSMWGSWSDADFMRCYTRLDGVGFQRIAETTDNWTGYTLSPNLQTVMGSGFIVGLAPIVQEADEDMIAFAVARLGQAPNHNWHAVWTMYALTGTPVGKAGSSSQSAPFTDSVPFDIGQIAQNGLQFVRGS